MMGRLLGPISATTSGLSSNILRKQLILPKILFVVSLFIPQSSYSSSLRETPRFPSPILVQEDPGECMRISERECNPDRLCSLKLYEKSCLESNFSISDDNIAKTVDRLTSNLIAIKDLATVKSSAYGLQYPIPLSSVYGFTTPYFISSYVVTENGVAGSPPVMKIATLASRRQRDWADLKGRRLVVVSPLESCIDTKSAMALLSASRHFSNPLVARWFTTQLPCGYSDASLHSGDSLSSSLWPEKMALIPMGVRNPSLFRKVLSWDNPNERITLSQSRSGSSQRSSPAARIMVDLDCSCACGRASIAVLGAPLAPLEGCVIAGQLAKQGFPQCEPYLSHNNSSSIGLERHKDRIRPDGADVREDESEYYKQLLLRRPRFMLSASTPGRLSHCEWEAAIVGAVPLVSQSLWNYSQVIRDLFEGLTVLPVDDWTAVTPTWLHTKYAEIVSGKSISSPVHANSAKLFSPYWLNKFTTHLISGKPPSRFFSNVSRSLHRLQPQCHELHSPASSQPSVLWKPRAKKRQSYSRGYSRNTAVSSDGNHGNSSSDGSFTLEVVFPRCCEDGVELSWLPELLRSTRNVRVSIIYKCPACIPSSEAQHWLRSEPYATSSLAVMNNDKKNKKASVSSYGSSSSNRGTDEEGGSKKDESSHTPRGVRLFTDPELASFVASGRVRQFRSFDARYNGKEVTAYLQHIIRGYENAGAMLADQTVFLHSVPHAHLNFAMLFRSIRWAEVCATPVHFVHLNARFKSGGEWGSCCGSGGRPTACRDSVWDFLFLRDEYRQRKEDIAGAGSKGSAVFQRALQEAGGLRARLSQFYSIPYPDSAGVGTYSSAQFSVSRAAILSQPLTLWHRMLAAINGSYDLAWCKTNNEPGVAWGGHQLTGQYERIWHLVFGLPAVQRMRVRDESLPPFLRHDCDCPGAV